MDILLEKTPYESWEFLNNSKNLTISSEIKLMFSFQVLRPFLRLVTDSVNYIDFKIWSKFFACTFWFWEVLYLFMVLIFIEDYIYKYGMRKFA